MVQVVVHVMVMVSVSVSVVVCVWAEYVVPWVGLEKMAVVVHEVPWNDLVLVVNVVVEV